MFFSKNLFNTINYLNRCDLITKYNFAHFRLLPSINSITLNLSLEQLNTAEEISKNSLKYQICLYFYFCFGILPKILKVKTREGKSYNTIKLAPIINIQITNLFLIQQFLFLFFIENQSYFKGHNFFNFCKNFDQKIIATKMLNLFCDLPLSLLKSLSIFDKEFVKNFFFRLNFVINVPTLSLKLNTKKLIQNLCFFWRAK